MSEIIGNEAVLERLELCLQEAAAHDLKHIAVSMVGYPDRARITHLGDTPLRVPQLEALRRLTGQLEADIANSTAPRDASLDASYHCYNALEDTLSFDFLIWLVEAELHRRRENAPAPLKVGFFLGHDPHRNDPGREKRQGWLANIGRPALRLIGAVEDPRAVGGRRSNVFMPRPLVEAACRGEEMPVFRAPSPLDELGADPRPPAPVTITLREAAHWPHRNSDIAAWFRFAMDLKRRGRRVVFIRDTAKAHEPIAGFETDPAASLDLCVRMARYESAAANLFVANGPVGLALFSDVPWLQFVPLEAEDSAYEPNTPKFWREQNGIAPGEQYPWSGPAQRIVWESATYAAITRAWSEIEGLIR